MKAGKASPRANREGRATTARTRQRPGNGGQGIKKASVTGSGQKGKNLEYIKKEEMKRTADT